MVKRRGRKGKSKATDGDAKKYHISKEAIVHSTGLKLKQAEQIAGHIYAIDEDNFWEVVVVTLDMRKSSTALVHVEDYEEYSNVLKDYICYVAERCKHHYPSQVVVTDKKGKELKVDENGWFDKFTGDGVLLFWRLPDEPEEHKPYYYRKADSKNNRIPRRWPQKTPYNDKIDSYKLTWNMAIRHAIEFSIEVVAQFLETALPEFRKTCGCVPVDFGISAGIDAGECLLTAIEPSDDFEKRYRKRYGLRKSQKARASQNVTVIGRPVIGASRMVEAARPYEILVKSYPGGALRASFLEPSGIHPAI